VAAFQFTVDGRLVKATPRRCSSAISVRGSRDGARGEARAARGSCMRYTSIVDEPLRTALVDDLEAPGGRGRSTSARYDLGQAPPLPLAARARTAPSGPQTNDSPANVSSAHSNTIAQRDEVAVLKRGGAHLSFEEAGRPLVRRRRTRQVALPSASARMYSEVAVVTNRRRSARCVNTGAPRSLGV
jgi:hypothetical protein